MSFRRIATIGVAAGLVLAGALAPPKPAAAEAKLALVYPFPDFLIYTKLCKQLAASITKQSGGAVTVDVLPFNSIKMFQQPGAVKAGRVDVSCIPIAFFARAVPENEVMSTSNSSPAMIRKNGGMAILDGIHQKVYGTKLLGWTGSGAHFRIYMKNQPGWTKDGLLQLKGVKLRDNPIYGAFFRALKGETHNLPATAVYGALEKGVVNASAWATVGLPGLKWDKFLRHAVEPTFYQTDIIWMMNLKRWKGLDNKAQTLLQDAVLAQEASSRALLLKMAVEEKKLLMKNGMKFHTAPNAEAYYKLAVDSAYARITKRLKDAGKDTAHVAKLRGLFQE